MLAVAAAGLADSCPPALAGSLRSSPNVLAICLIISEEQLTAARRRKSGRECVKVAGISAWSIRKICQIIKIISLIGERDPF